MKNDFPIFSDKQRSSLIYLDSAATTHKPACVIDAISNFYANEYATVHRGVYESANAATNKLENVRNQVAQFISCQNDEVIFTHSTTESINLLAYSYGNKFIGEGDEVLVCIAEHHSNFLPWKMLCERKKGIFKTFGLNKDGTIDLDHLKSQISDKTKIVAVSHQSNVLGLVNPVKEIATIAHDHGAVVVVDGAQMIAHDKIDVTDVDADFYAFSAHKMYGPTGVGVLFGKKTLLENMDPFHGGGGMVEVVTEDQAVYREPPHKFEAGTPMIASIIGLGTAIEYIESIGFEKIREHEEDLSIRFFDALKDHVEFITPLCRGSSILSFYPNDIHPLDLSVLLSLDNICIRVGNMCAQPLLNALEKSDVCRLSLGIYNTEADLLKFMDSLRNLKQTT